jgi:hypothetical protein
METNLTCVYTGQYGPQFSTVIIELLCREIFHTPAPKVRETLTVIQYLKIESFPLSSSSSSSSSSSFSVTPAATVLQLDVLLLRIQCVIHRYFYKLTFKCR